jgi:hypothetical protein
MKWLATLQPYNPSSKSNAVVVDDGGTNTDPSNPSRLQLDPGYTVMLPVISAREYNPDTDYQIEYGVQQLGDIYVPPVPDVPQQVDSPGNTESD